MKEFEFERKNPIVFPTFKMQQVLNIFYDSPVKYIFFTISVYDN